MKQYLTMADVFADSAKKGTNLVCGKTLVAKFVDGVECEYSVHAINSHDELVQMTKDMLAELEDAATSLETIQLRSFGEDSFLDSKPEMRSYAGSRASVVRAAIAKAKGGAA